MPAITDIVNFFLSLIFLSSGWQKGLIKSLIGPSATLICFFMAFKYINELGPLLAFGLAILGPLVLSLFLSLVLKIWSVFIDNKQPPMLLSRVLGGILSLSWGITMIALGLIVAGILPPQFYPNAKIRQDILASQSYSAIQSSLFNRIEVINHLEAFLKVQDNPQQSQALQATPEFEMVYQHPKIQKLLNDEKTMGMVKQRDMVGLMTDPNILALWQDKELLEKFLKLSEKSSEISTAP